MEVIRDMNSVPNGFKNCIVTIGNFDGIHLGHQAIFQQIIKEAGETNTKSAIITFSPHPQKVLHPEKRPFFLLTPLEEKLKLIESQKIDAVVLIPFSMEFSRITAEEFVNSILWDKLRIKKILVGYDYVFGKNRKGNADYLRNRGAELGFEVEEIKPVLVDETIVSSTKIRHLILDGNVKQAADFFGRPYVVCGTVVKGYQRGADIGIRTANIKHEKVIPAVGVYAIISRIKGNNYKGVLNIGWNPTFENDEISTEVHIFDFNEDIYGQKMEISFIDRLRDEKKFESPEKLVEQIKKDIETAKRILTPYI